MLDAYKLNVSTAPFNFKYDIKKTNILEKGNFKFCSFFPESNVKWLNNLSILLDNFGRKKLFHLSSAWFFKKKRRRKDSALIILHSIHFRNFIFSKQYINWKVVLKTCCSNHNTPINKSINGNHISTHWKSHKIPFLNM